MRLEEHSISAFKWAVRELIVINVIYEHQSLDTRLS